MKSNKNIVVKIITSVFQLVVEELHSYFLRKQIRIEFKQSKSTLRNATQMIQIIGRSKIIQQKHCVELLDRRT